MPTPAVIQYPTRTEPATRGRRANVTPGRWATIYLSVRQSVGLDYFVREEVINISMMIPPTRPPELPGLTGAPTDVAYDYYLERVPLGVKIGMVRGGTGEASGGFGFPEGEEVTVWIWFMHEDYSGYVALIEDI